MNTGSLLRAAREAAGISLRVMAERTFYSRSYLSQIEKGQRPLPAGVAAAYERVLGTTDLGRLTVAARTPSSVDAQALAEVDSMLTSIRRVEDATGALAVLPAVRGMSAMVEQFVHEARTVQREAATLASEVTQYRAWLEHAVGADTAARRSMDTAVELATEARDPDRLVHSLGFTGYVTWGATGDYAEVLDLSDAALNVPGAHPVVTAYARMRRAELLAARGERREALTALAAADEAAEAASGEQAPNAMYWWTAPFGAIQRGGVLSLLGEHPQAVAEATAGLADMPPQHRGTEWLASALRRVDPDLVDA
ncbi:helix-turn-helix domain-containing protein [Nocardia blacklockiae]|uniref:helix-turn-helix domain-containing protein n=1 Tax=Nocardia blacklockiae TaxID=480036 RepID=UPI001895926B|nr:helix-turn-helix domain-containing protein [Nocardia blacklockiae]MBF6172540.1 helix-turn-helix domain-containing protein [Nocardia blacklockiae]